MDNESPTSTADPVVSTTRKLMLTTGLLAVALWLAKRLGKEPLQKRDRPIDGQNDSGDHPGQADPLKAAQLSDHQTGKPERPERDWYDKGTLILNAVMVFVVVFGTVIAVATLKNLDRSTKAAEAAAVATQKQADLLSAQVDAAGAQLLVTNISLAEPLRLGGPVWMKCSVKNAGDTPARYLRLDWSIQIRRAPAPPPDPNGPAASITVLGPDGIAMCPDAASVWLNGIADYRWTEADEMRVSGGQERLYVQVFADYVTIFGKKRHTELCGYWEVSAITACPTGNDIR